MSLKEFLEQRALDPALGESVHARIERWRTAALNLIQRLRRVLQPHARLELEEWTVVLQEQAVRYNAAALTIRFQDVQITVEPKGTFLPPGEGNGRVTMECGARLVLLDWRGEESWTYWWSLPQHDEPARPLTDTIIEDLVQELLA